MRPYFLIAFIACAFNRLNAQEYFPPRDFIISSKVFKSERKVSVYLPFGSETADSLQSFAVAYVFDGQFSPYTEMVSSISRYAASSGIGIPLIVVGIHTEKRWEEFVPAVENDQIVPNEAAEQLSQFLSEEVEPLITSKFHTTPFRLGVGHSLGGTFVMHEIMKPNSLFQAVIAVSPNLTMYNEFMVQRGEVLFQQTLKAPLFVYAAGGTSGSMESNFSHSLANLNKAFISNPNANIFWEYEQLEGENHMSTFVPTFNKGYAALSSRLLLTDDNLQKVSEDTTHLVQDLRAFYAEQSRLGRVEKTLNVEELMLISKQAMDLEAYDGAVVLAKESLKLLATDPRKEKEKKELTKQLERRIQWCAFNALAANGKKLFEQKDYKAAAEYYKKAFDTGEMNGTHPVRIASVSALAQAGELELAFKQLELLAEFFELGGNGAFLYNPYCEPLKSDPRWEKYMKRLEENGKKYR
jgi:predicted alpha/beta superfamily hydrolase